MKIGGARKQRALIGKMQYTARILHDRLGHVHLRKLTFILGKCCYRERGLETERKMLNGGQTCIQAKGYKINSTRELIYDENTLHGTVLLEGKIFHR